MPDDIDVLHSCDNPPCVRPDHLFAGTQQDNALDASRKGRLATGAANGAVLHPERLPRGEHHGGAKLDTATVMEIRCRWPGDRQVDLAAEFGIAQTTVSKIVRGEKWAHVS